MQVALVRKTLLSIGIVLFSLSTTSILAQNADGQPQGGNNGGENRTGGNGGRGGIGGGGSGLGGYLQIPAAGRVPYHLYDIVLGRPTDTSMTLSLVAYEPILAYLEFGPEADKGAFATEKVQIEPEQAEMFLMDNLEKDSTYYYRLVYQLAEESDDLSNNEFSQSYEFSETFQFNTPRSFGSDFVFTLQADSHLDENTSAEVYTNALLGALGHEPDFHLALGDTFMVDKYIQYPSAHPHYLAQRYFFGLLSHSAPLFFALGNHDAESGNVERMDWSTQTRNTYFPNPSPNEFYSGNAGSTPEGEPVRNYYSYEWGNSLFVALDPFRYNEGRGGRGADNWYMTLGKTQYDWLAQTLVESEATFKFVYLHNLVGGAESNRGGAEASLNFEWGGHEYDGTYSFDENRPGWGKPIHDLLVENDVSIVLHGHDHMYIHQERDGMVYQLVPQPGHPSGNVNSAAAYGYLSGNIVEGSGYLRVGVSEDEVQVEFYDSRIGRAGNLLHSYEIQAPD